MIYRGTTACRARTRSTTRSSGSAATSTRRRRVGPRNLLADAAARIARRGVRALRRSALGAGLPRHRRREGASSRGDPRGSRRRRPSGQLRQHVARAHLWGPPARVHNHGERDPSSLVRRDDAARAPRAPLHCATTPSWCSPARSGESEALRLAERDFGGSRPARGSPRSPPPRAQTKPRLEIIENVSSQTELRVCLRATSESSTPSGRRSRCSCASSTTGCRPVSTTASATTRVSATTSRQGTTATRTTASSTSPRGCSTSAVTA